MRLYIELNPLKLDLQLSSTIGSSYFAPYYPMNQHPCFQLQLYTSSAAVVHRRRQPFATHFIYIYRGPSAVQNRQSPHTAYPVQQQWTKSKYLISP